MKTSDWIIVTTQHGDPERTEKCSDVVSSISDCLITNCFVLRIYQDGRLVSDLEKENLMKLAYENLGPISKARVDGLF